MNLYESKQQLRKEIATLKKQYTAAGLAAFSAQIMERVEKMDVFREASCVALYHAIPGEVQTASFIEKWFRQKKLVLPLVKGNDLVLVRYIGEDSLRPGAFGILEPDEQGEKVVAEEIDLILVPGVAFDRQKNRLGRGKGYYDRLLASASLFKIGLCFDFQLKETVPTEPFDRKMDLVVTEREIIL